MPVTVGVVTIAAADFLPPNGPLDPVLFPQTERRKVATNIDAWITVAAADARLTDLEDSDKVNAIMHLTRARAYQQVVIEMSRVAATLSVAEKGSHGFTDKQIQNFKDLAAEELAAVVDIIAVEVVEPLFPDSGSTKTDISWYAGRSSL